jgi:hypothetical protein
MRSRPTSAHPSRSRQGALPAMLLAVTLTAALAGRSPAAEQPQPAEPTAEQKYKNIQVLKGMPASQLMPVMHLMRASLGTRCDFCHVAEGNQYALDTKREKETARKMIRMVLAINKDTFGGQTRVTCNTCHRGQEHPVRVPPIGQGQFDDTTHGATEAEEGRETLPSAAEVLDRYIQALGGRAALEAVTSRVSRGALLRMKVIGSGTPKAWAVNRGQAEPIEIVQPAPDRVTVTLGPPSQQLVQRVEGTSGTFQSPGGERPMTPEEIADLTRKIDLRKDLKLRERADKAQVIGREPLDGRDVFVLRMQVDDGTFQRLYFDVGTGLLRRQIVYQQTVLGPDPEQTDFDDYRDVGGVKVPFVVKTSYLDDNHLGTTRKLIEVQDNKAAGQQP